MRSKAYRKLVEGGIETGEIPADIGGDVLEKMSAKGRMTPEIYAGFLRALEERGLYHTFTTPYNRSPRTIDGDFRYESRNPLFYLFKGLVVGVYNTLGRVVAYALYGLRVKGKANRRTGGGAVTVSNHFSYLDVLATRVATGWRPLKIVVAPHNAGPGCFGRAIFRAGGVVPFGTTLSGGRNFNLYIEKCLKKGKLVHFYAERSMWLDYPKPRPLLTGAFTIAAKLDVPVVPIFYAYRKRGFVRRLLRMHAPMTAYILPPVRADKTLGLKARAEALKNAVERAQQAAYEAHRST